MQKLETHNMNDLVNLTYEDVKNFIYKYENNINSRWLNLNDLVTNIFNSIPDLITVNDFYNYVANYCATKISFHPDYNKLASIICVDRLHLATKDNIRDAYNKMAMSDSCTITKDVLNIINDNYELIMSKIDMKRDYLFDYFGIRTLERSYLLKIYDSEKNKIIIERPQYMIMRIAIGIHGNNLVDVFETYDLISNRFFTHATPTLFNAGTNKSQLSSCFLLDIDDNLENIFNKINEIAMISKWAGGIGVNLSNIRARGSLIKGTGGTTDGILPLCIVLNKVAKYVNQGGKRSGSIACYLEPWHADVYDFYDLRKANSGNDDNRARDLFLGSWIPDLFMKRVESNDLWSLMCPNECPNLVTSYGNDFEKLYTEYERLGKFKKQVLARDLWQHLMIAQIETGFTYMLYKDHVNHKSNQKNLGTIKSSNLCAEIVEYTDSTTTAVCNLASICLPRFIVDNKFDYDQLIKVCKVIVKNLNKIIDINFYTNDFSKTSNFKNRPIGIGVQGLADVYNLFGYPYESVEATELNKKIFEVIYFACLTESNELAKTYGHYDSFVGSPFSEGKLQYHLWGLENTDLLTYKDYDWDVLVENIKKYGTRNSLLTALMPTAGTSQIMKCYESFEPYMSNVFVRTTLAGEFIVINENLINKLLSLDLWTDDVRKLIIIKNGSIQDIDTIPAYVKNIYKTAFELKLMSIIDQSADRGPFIDQTQSMNLFMDKPNYKRLLSAHFYGWKRGLKTGMYYLRTTSAVNPIQFGIDISDIIRLTGSTSIIDIINNGYKIEDTKKSEEVEMCKFDPKKLAEGCLMCSS
jgi:ribonucleoside-diphosphate reductase alpha subunit